MLGNLGFNKAVCVSDYVQLDAPRVLGCEIGYMSDLKFYGIIPNTEDMNASDMPYGYCNDPNTNSDVQYCTETYLDSTIVSDFNTNC